MKIEQTKNRNGETGNGWVLFGSRPDGKWLEKWFATEEAAKAYAAKRGFELK